MNYTILLDAEIRLIQNRYPYVALPVQIVANLAKTTLPLLQVKDIALRKVFITTDISCMRYVVSEVCYTLMIYRRHPYMIYIICKMSDIYIAIAQLLETRAV